MTSELRFRDAFHDALPIIVSGFVFGIVFGVLASKSGWSPLSATLMSALVFAGASQFIAVEQWASGHSSGLAVVLTTLLVNLRHVLMCISLRRQFRHESRLRLVPSFALLLIDETWALAEHRFRNSRPSLAYFVLAGLLIYVGWVGGTWIGTQVGSHIPRPSDLGLDFTFIAMFLSLMVLLWRQPSDFVTWLTSGILAYFAARLPGIGQASVVVAAVCASAAVAASPSLAGQKETT
ncbi:AzlC family ABC transporter permease [Burkholderia latens]|uniref:AzlC family ABC transporter permease n=1 Tax=Burkholderia latens TaxID=488446 RepID=A0A6H9SSR1_9BURK|nr:AzlC family ABC transporter permease [Burkholderia latens]KAB0644181.1 AzlC family ABC transporter permease [Burkholderia latens]VWB44204.1 AzlC family protein [Burkholderia latens]